MYDLSNYAYIVGRVRALETQMLDQNNLERLIDAPRAEDAFRVLNDLPLVTESMGDHGVRDFQKILLESLKSLKGMLIQMAPYPEVLNFLWHKYDFHNLKVVLKAKFMEYGYADIEHALINIGTIPLSDFEGYLLEDSKINLGADLPTVIKHARVAYEKTPNPQIVDLEIDHYYLSVLQRIVSSTNSSLLSAYLVNLIDASNLLTFIRCHELKRELPYLKQMLFDGGRISLELFISAFERGYDELKQILEPRMYTENLVFILEAFMEDRNLLMAEKKMMEGQQQFMQEAQKIAFGPEPVFAFYWRFENHLQIIRTVLVAKLNRSPSNDLRKQVLAL
ncbi:hypothetical protein COY07_04065 [Candidatus Peregrinibacteria bacterium CG_4_10_14_0_2_um_filter_43_11]|nr:MAG: hypothetical protein COY07_04065 [Candidatus Peregrinibacteria bacterium CG_4_10_14_0_2_um_filter_43_11]